MENDFVNWMFYKDNATTLEFIKWHLSIKREDFLSFLSAIEDEWVNIDIKISKGWKYYLQVNNWKPEWKTQQPKTKAQQPKTQLAPKEENISIQDVPF